MVSLAPFILFHLVPIAFTWSHLVSLGFVWFHLDSLGLNWSHLPSLGFTWSHLVLLCFTWIHLVSLGFIWSHKEWKRESLPLKKGKGKRPDLEFHPDLTTRTGCAYARAARNETVSRLSSMRVARWSDRTIMKIQTCFARKSQNPGFGPKLIHMPRYGLIGNQERAVWLTSRLLQTPEGPICNFFDGKLPRE